MDAFMGNGISDEDPEVFAEAMRTLRSWLKRQRYWMKKHDSVRLVHLVLRAVLVIERHFPKAPKERTFQFQFFTFFTLYEVCSCNLCNM